MTFLLLFWEFFKTGLLAIGGGMATVPFLQDIAARTGWYTMGQLADLIAVSESTPGPLGVNMATYVGYTVGSGELGVFGGILGAVISTLGLIFPSVVIILVIAYFLDKFRSSRTVQDTMYGLRPASVALISAAGVSILLIAVFGVSDVYHIGDITFDWRSIALFLAVFVLTRYVPRLKKLHPVCFIAVSALVGIALGMGS